MDFMLIKKLRLLSRHGLVFSDQDEHMYCAAMNYRGCNLTTMGAHYSKLAEMKRI